MHAKEPSLGGAQRTLASLRGGNRRSTRSRTLQSVQRTAPDTTVVQSQTRVNTDRMDHAANTLIGSVVLRIHRASRYLGNEITVLATTLLVVSACMITCPAAAGAAPSRAGNAAAAPLPSVDMAKVLVAAQLEPACGQTAALSDNSSTILVQQALTASGIKTAADGWYGNGTTASYRTWQRKLGYSGIDANGLPGVASLTKLGVGRFTVGDKISIGSRHNSYGGQRVNARTETMLQAADDLLTSWNFSLLQGSYHPGVRASAGTHDGGGVVDVSVQGLSAAQRWQEVKALRTVGFAAWLRTPAENLSYHIHAVAIGDVGCHANWRTFAKLFVARPRSSQCLVAS